MDLLLNLHPKQQKALESFATELMFGGAAGPGKSHYGRCMSVGLATAIPGLQIFIFRRRYADLINGHMKGPTGFEALLAEAERAGFVKMTENTIEFRNGPGGQYEGGSRISLNHCQYESDALSFKTIEFHVLWLEEATEFTQFQICYLRSRVRIPDTVKIPESFLVPKQFWRDAGKPEYSIPRILYTTNPGGPGHAYLKQAIWDASNVLPPYSVWRAPESDGGYLRQYIPALLEDNPSIDRVAYAAGLKGIGSAEYVRALLLGDWSVVLGSFFSELREDLHLIPDHKPPEHCFKFCWYDWGFAQPAANISFYVSDGEPVIGFKGELVRLPRGALVAYRELYFARNGPKNQGAELDNRSQARILKAAHAGENISAFLADHRPFNRSGENVTMCPAKEFLEEGVRLIASEHPREMGWSLTHTRLCSTPPMLYFCRRLTETWRTMQGLQTKISKPEDAETTGEDHLPDCVRGACTVQPLVKVRQIPDDKQLEADWAKKPTMIEILDKAGYGGIFH